MANPFPSSVKEFFQAWSKKNTYDLKNHYFWFGFFWGLPVPLFMFGFILSLESKSFSFYNVWQLLSQRSHYWIFILPPFVLAFVFAAMGTIRLEQHKKINLLINKLKKESTHDYLTGLYNRAYFEELLKKEMYRSKRHGGDLAVIMIDIDYFKKINDQYGHLVGDKVLVELGCILQAKCRPYDAAARWGGEEFTLILPQSDLLQAEQIAERIRSEFAETTFFLEKHKVVATLSAGVTIYMEGDELSTLMERVDAALYEAKRAGRNCKKSIDYYLQEI